MQVRFSGFQNYIFDFRVFQNVFTALIWRPTRSRTVEDAGASQQNEKHIIYIIYNIKN